jgi:hypothetical protein
MCDEKPEPCEFCGSFTCSFVREQPGNQSARHEAAVQEIEFKAGTRKQPPETADQVAARRFWADVLF